MKNAILVMAALALAGSAGNAATYYCKNGGSDAAAGTPSAPWAHCPGMSGWTGTAALAAGDTVYFDNASTFVGSSVDHVIIATGGVYYDGRSWGSATVNPLVWGSGRATFTSSVGFIQEKGIIRIDTDHPAIPTVFHGFYLPGNISNSDGVRFAGAGAEQDRITGAEKRLEDLWCYQNGVDTMNWSYGIEVTTHRKISTGAYGIVKNVNIYNCHVRKPHRSGIVIYPNGENDSNLAQNVVVRGCEVDSAGQSAGNSHQSVGSGIAIKNRVDSCIVEYCYCHDNIGSSTLDGSGLGIEVANSSTSSSLGSSRCTVRYCILTHNRFSGMFIYASGGRDLRVYGNIIARNNSKAMDINCVHQTNCKMRFYNNLFYRNYANPVGWAGGDVDFTGDMYTFDTLEFINNIFITDSSSLSGPRICMYSDVANTAPTKITNNLFYRIGMKQDQNLVKQVSYYTVGTIKSFDAHALTTWPAFSDTSALPTGFSGTYGVDMTTNTTGFSLTASPIDSGYTLPALYSGAINFSGKRGNQVRPLGNAWDIGPYESEAETAIAQTSTAKGKVNRDRQKNVLFIRLLDVNLALAIPASLHSPELTIVDISGREVSRMALKKGDGAGYNCSLQKILAPGTYFAVVKKQTH